MGSTDVEIAGEMLHDQVIGKAGNCSERVLNSYQSNCNELTEPIWAPVSGAKS